MFENGPFYMDAACRFYGDNYRGNGLVFRCDLGKKSVMAFGYGAFGGLGWGVFCQFLRIS